MRKMQWPEVWKGVSIGAGYFSQYHLDAWKRIPDVHLTALCDLDPKAAEKRKNEFGIKSAYTDYREMIDSEKPDFIDIITPPATHLDICRYASRKGIHILCQKPLAPNYQECQTIVDEVHTANVRFMVNDNWRWQPWYREIKKMLAEKVIGEVTSVYFQMRMGDGWGKDAYLKRQPFFREYPKLLIYETGVHFIDTFRFLFGEIKKVYAQLRQLNPVIKGEDSAQVLFSFENGTTAILDASRYNENETGVNLYTCDPRTTFGILRLDGLDGHIIMDSCGDIIVKPLGKDSYRQDYDHQIRGFAGDSCYHALKHFIDGLNSGCQFETSGSDYLKTLRVVEACYESSETGLPVGLKHPSI
jgi:predicted dehydrogenase